MPEQKNFKSSFLCPILCPLTCMKKLTRPVIESKQRLAEFLTRSLTSNVQPRPEDALHVFPYQVSEAAFLNGPDRTLFLFLLEPAAASLRVLQLSRAEGFRGQEVGNCQTCYRPNFKSCPTIPPDQFQVQWSRAPNLTLGPGPSTQALNCAQSKWQGTFSP